MNLTKLSTLCVCFCAGALASAATVTPAFDKDVERFANAFGHSDVEVLDEALVQLRWAGITDRRIYDPLISQLTDPNRLSELGIRKYFEALSMSGNPEIYAELEKMSKNTKLKGGLRSKAKSAMKEFPKYQKIAETMSVGLEAAKTNDELWAIRHKNGLAVADASRVRLAARDIYLHGYEKESLDVAAETLRANTDTALTDRQYIDAMAFLCKALGLSGRREYKDTLIFVANNTKTPKLQDYAERSAQYFDRSFKADNKNKTTSSAQSR